MATIQGIPVDSTTPTNQQALVYIAASGKWVPTTILELVNPQTGTLYTVLTTDLRKLVTFSNTSPVAVTLPQAGASFPNGWYTDFTNENTGLVTITPTTSTIDGLTSLTLSQNQGFRLVSDGVNYFTVRGRPPALIGVLGATIVAADVGNPQFITVPFNCTITSWTIMADVSGSASVNVWFLAGTAPPTAPSIPTSGNKISASAPIATTSAQSAAGGATAISTWNPTALTQWGTLAFNLSSITTSTKVTIQIQVTRS